MNVPVCSVLKAYKRNTGTRDFWKLRRIRALEQQALVCRSYCEMTVAHRVSGVLRFLSPARLDWDCTTPPRFLDGE